MLILLVSMVHGLLCGTLRAPQTSVTVAATIAKAPCTISRPVSRPSKTDSISWALTARSPCGLRPRPLAVGSKSRRVDNTFRDLNLISHYRYWNSTPTGEQWAAIGFTSFSHGAIGEFMMIRLYITLTSPTRFQVIPLPNHIWQCDDNREYGDSGHGSH